MNEDRYVVVRTINGHTWATRPHGRELALDLFEDSTTTIGSVYAPHTGNRIRVMSRSEWQRIRAGAR